MGAKKQKYDVRPTMRVQCGSLKWEGKAECFDEAIIAALAKTLPEEPSILLRVHDGWRWNYINFESALKIAGYKIKKTKNGFMVVV